MIPLHSGPREGPRTTGTEQKSSVPVRFLSSPSPGVYPTNPHGKRLPFLFGPPRGRRTLPVQRPFPTRSGANLTPPCATYDFGLRKPFEVSKPPAVQTLDLSASARVTRTSWPCFACLVATPAAMVAPQTLQKYNSFRRVFSRTKTPFPGPCSAVALAFRLLLFRFLFDRHFGTELVAYPRVAVCVCTIRCSCCICLVVSVRFVSLPVS